MADVEKTYYFVVAYKRSEARLLRFAEFADVAAARQARLETELQFRGDPDVEVTVLSARNRNEIEKTHSRYFGNARKMTPTG